MNRIDYNRVNPNDFTQKDLMLHLLQVSQHTVTREEVKDDILALDKKMDISFANVDKRFNDLETSINQRFEQVDKKIDKLDMKFDKLQWFLVAGALVILFKEQILSLIGAN